MSQILPLVEDRNLIILMRKWVARQKRPDDCPVDGVSLESQSTFQLGGSPIVDEIIGDAHSA